jgi:hypothetical protein
MIYMVDETVGTVEDKTEILCQTACSMGEWISLSSYVNILVFIDLLKGDRSLLLILY